MTSARRVMWPLVAEYGLANAGHWAAMSVFSLYLVEGVRLAPAAAGALSLLTAFSVRSLRLVLAPAVDRLTPRSAMLAACALGACGFALLAARAGVLLIVAGVLLFGAGYGTNALAAKVAAGTVGGTGDVRMRYAVLNVGLNVGSGAGPLLAAALVVHRGYQPVFWLAAGGYAAAGLVVALLLPAGERGPARQGFRWRDALGMALASAPVRRLLLYCGLGFLLYSQLYASLPLYVNGVLHRPDLLGTLFGLNAVLIVTAQVPAMQAVSRLRVGSTAVVAAAYALFGLGFLLAWQVPVIAVGYLAVALWTLAEILLMPSLDALASEAGGRSGQVATFALSGLAIAIGEGLGSFAGVALSAALGRSGELPAVFGLFTAASAVAVGAVLVTGRRRLR